MDTDTNEQTSVKSFTNADGQKIACKYWQPNKSEPRALIFICHGAGEHIRCYDAHGSFLADQGYLVFGHDHVGHGLSEGSRVHINSFTEYTRDVLQHIDLVTGEHQGIPLFVIGHSLGGTIALKTGLERPSLFSGMILIGPAVKPNPETATRFKVAAAKVVARVLPQLGVGAVAPKWISRDQSIVSKYESDPLVYHGKLKARMVVQLMMAMTDIMSRTSEVTWPLYTVCGTEDKLVEPSGCTLLQEMAASKDKTLKMIDGAFHQVHNEPDGVGSQCMQEIRQWITDRC